MTSKGQRYLPLLLATAFGLAGSLTGCSQLQSSLAQQPHEMTVKATPEPAVQPPTDQRRQATVNAVQEFLTRTEEYQLGAAQAIPPASDLPPNMDRPPSPDVNRRPRAPDHAAVVSVATPQADAAVANTRVTLSESVPPEATVAIPVVESISIRTASPVPSPPQAAQDQPSSIKTTNQPLEVHVEDAVVTTDRFVEHLETLAAEARDLDSEWQLRLVQLALSRDGGATDVSADLSGDTRSVLLGLIRLGLEIRRLVMDPLSSGEDALNRLDELQQVLADRADPIVSGVALCRKVVTFGVYEEMSDVDFIAGRTTPTIVYSEIRNLRSELAEDGQYRTLLGTRLEVLTSDGESVWEHAEPEILDRCRRRRTDFFIAQRITLPPTLPPGEFVLKVLVEDKISGKANEATRRFSIGSTATRTAGR